LNFDPSDIDVNTEYKSGLVQAGDRLKRDGSLPQTWRTSHDKLYAVEMEGGGFAQACESDDHEWMVFRGISDFGDPEKRDKKQAVAAVAAAALVRQFSPRGPDRRA
jgi:nucleoside phosphorylase